MLDRHSPSAAACRADLVRLTCAGVLWGTGGFLGSLLQRSTDLSSWAVAAYRLGTGGLLLLVFAVLTGNARPRGRRTLRRIVVVGLLTAEFQSTYFGAVAATSVSLATLVTIGSSPVLVALAEAALRRRRLDAPSLGVLAAALTGLTLLVGAPGAGSAVGVGLAVASGAGFAALTLVNAGAAEDVDPATTTCWGFLVGALMLLPLTDLSFAPSASGVGLILALGLIPTAVAYLLFFRGMRTQPAGTGAILALLEPLAGTGLAVTFLGDRFAPAQLVGAAVLAGAIVANVLRGPARPRHAPERC